ncbi:MAG: hydrolase [Gammaproteobacteria bacterium]|jgi:predicted alpha/beta-fold hydrolase
MPEKNPPSFEPAWWLPGPHLPTLWAALARRRPEVTPRHERLELADGDFLDLGWVGSESGPLVVLLHGLEGSSRSKYALALAGLIERAGWGGVVLQFRGCSGEPNRLDRSYHSGDTGDLKTVLVHLRQRFPRRQFFAVGYSLGGNVLLKHLGEIGPDSDIAAAAAVSVPFDLAAGAERLNQGISRLYQYHLIRSLKRKVREKFAHRSAPIDLSDLDLCNDFWSFDDRITAPLHGFRNAEEYYRQSSCRQFLGTIQTPTLLLQAADDPFLLRSAIPGEDELSPTTALQLTRRGGHVGFVAGRNPLQPEYWIDERLMAWFATHVNDCASNNT